MSQQTISRRYAQALYGQAETEGVTEAVDTDIRMIREAVLASRELELLFETPIVPRERKRAVVRALFGGHVTDLTTRFVEMLVDKRRERLLVDVADAYLALRDDQLGVTEVSVRTARPLSAADEQAIGQTMGQFTGKTTRLDVTVDPMLMGGLVVRVGDTVYDGSVLNRLESLRDRLVHGSVAAG